MKNVGHTFFIVFLFVAVIAATVVIGVNGYGYYRTPLKERAFHPLHESLKPGGLAGHGYGVIGTLMIVSGVILYSSRKRLRALSQVGRIKNFLELHIFLCVAGPVLIVYHTTFKIGGLVAVSFWSMVAVALSGLVGRYFYVQVPRGIKGNELSAAELTKEHEELGIRLRAIATLSERSLQVLDSIASPPGHAAAMSLGDIVRFFVLNDLTRRRRVRHLLEQLSERGVGPQTLRQLRQLANRRVVLTRRIAFLEQVRRMFHYWHVIHLPFSIIMFLILAVHVGVTVAFGFTWLW